MTTTQTPSGIMSHAACALEAQCTLTSVSSARTLPPCRHAAMTEVRKHERIAAAAASTGDAPPLRFWTLFGIAQSCRGLPAGLLFHPVPGGMPLREALACCDEDDEDELAAWPGAIAATVEALHVRGAVWGNAVVDNIVVDEDGEIWLTKHEELWVDQASDTAMERDWNIARLIQEHIEGLRAAISEDG